MMRSLSTTFTLLVLAGAVVSCSGSQTTQDGGPPDGSTKMDSSHDAPHDRSPGDGGSDSGGCTGGKSSCGGKCVDLQTDNANCGGCGLTCAACAKGECTTTIAMSAESPWGIAVDAKNVYWTSQGQCPSDGGVPTGSVASAPITGGAPVTLATAQGFPTAIAVNAKNLYWVNKSDCSGNGGAVVRSDLDGGALTPLASVSSASRSVLAAVTARAAALNSPLAACNA